MTLLTPGEVAKLLGVKEGTVRAWLRTGELKGIRLAGKLWRVEQEAFDAFIAKSREDGKADGKE